MQAFPPPQGLYDGDHEHDACGVAFVATLTGVPSHDIVVKALTALRNLEHRGAAGAEPNSGDGAGILLQVPDRFLREVTAELGFELPAPHAYAVGTAFIPGDAEQVEKTRERIEEIAAEEGLNVLGWRDVPVDPSSLGKTALATMPSFRQLFVSSRGSRVLGMGLERLAFCLRKRAEQ
jgi:glutamate synthase (NADPH) large chain